VSPGPPADAPSVPAREAPQAAVAAAEPEGARADKPVLGVALALLALAALLRRRARPAAAEGAWVQP
jgi:MYXO-CTERM domain-containing protein